MRGLAAAYPVWLWITALGLVALWWADRTSRAGLPRWRRRLSLVLRGSAVVATGLALAGVTLMRPADRQAVLFVLDASDSVPPKAREAALEAARRGLSARPAPDAAGLIVFGADALIEESASDHPVIGPVSSRTSGDASDLAAALRLAAGSFPTGCARRIVLLTDGNETAGRAEDEIPALRAAGIRVDALPLDAGPRRDALVDRIVLPDRVAENQTIDVTVLLDATHEGTGTLKLWRGRSYLGSAPVKFAAGRRTAHTFRDRPPGRGVHHYRAQLEPDGPDAHAANDVGEALAIVEGRPGVLYVHGGDEASAALVGALRAHGFSVETRGPGGVPARLSELAAFGVVILDDVAAPALSTEQHRLLASFVRDLGGGLAMMGGQHSFGAGGWYRTAVEDVLPVTMDLTRKKMRPRVSIVVVVDKSGSMSVEEGGVTKIRLAAEGAVNVVDLLQTGDRFGFNATDTEAQWIVPLAELGGDRRAITDALRGVTAGGGGILVYTGARAGYDALRRDASPVRHLLLFADTSDAEQAVGEKGQHVFDLARGALSERITCSVVGIGQPGDKDTELLRGIAAAGGGRFYLTESASSVPQIFSQDAMLASRSVLVEKHVEPRRTGESDVIRGVDAVPALEGYVATAVRPLAQTLLMAGDDDPILAHWTCGLGRTLAFTSDVAGPWSRNWSQWPGYAKLFAQGVQWLAGARGRGEYPARVQLSSGRGSVVVEAQNEDGEFVNFLNYRAQVVPPGQPGFSVPLEQVAPGRYEARFPARAEGSWLVNVQRINQGQASSAELAGAALPFSAEFRSHGPNLELLRKLTAATGGALLADDLASVHRHERPGPPEAVDPWRVLGRLAILLVVADVGVRRLAGWRRTGADALAGGAPVTASQSEGTARLLARLREMRERGGADTAPGDFVSNDAGSTGIADTGSAAPANVATADVNAASATDSRTPGDARDVTPGAPESLPGSASGATDGAQPTSHTSRLLEAKRRARERRDKGGRDA